MRSVLKQNYIPASLTLQLLLTHNCLNFSHHLLFHCGVLCNQDEHEEERHRQSVGGSNHHLQHTLVHVLRGQVPSVLKKMGHLGPMLTADL